MRALVVGASGQVGHALCQALTRRGHAVVGTYARAPGPSGTEPLDIRDHAAAARLVTRSVPDWIFCPAALTHVDYCEAHPEEAARTNCEAPRALAAAAARLEAGFVFYSTDYVFDGAAGPYAEDAPPNPLSAYGRIKWDGEQAVLAALPRALVVRTTWVYGPEPQGKNFVYQLVRRLRAGERMTVADDQVSTPTYNEDLAAASVALAERGATGIVHVAGPSLLDRYAFGVLAARTFGLDPELLVPVKTASLAQPAPRPLAGGLRADRARATASVRIRSAAEGLAAMRDAIAPAPEPR